MGSDVVCSTVIGNVIALDVGTDDERSHALFCEPMDFYGFAGQMCRLAEDESLRLSLIEKGRTNVRRFSWEDSTEKLIEILKKEVVE